MRRYELIKNVNFLSVPMFVLLFAILPLPYVYYFLLRILITGFALFCVYLELNEKDHDEKNKWLLLFGLLALIYNPIVPVHLTKLLWVIINLGSFAVFVSYKEFVEETISAATEKNERKEEAQEEARLEKAIQNILITSGLDPNDASYFPNFNNAQKAYFKYSLNKGDLVVLGDDQDNLIVQNFKPKLGQQPNAFMKEFAIAKELELDFTYFYYDTEAFEKAYALGEILGLSTVVIGTNPMNICFNDLFSGRDPESIFYSFSMTETRKDELAAEFYHKSYCFEEEDNYFPNDGVNVCDFIGYYDDIRNFVLKNGGDPNLIIQFHNEKHFKEAKDRNAIKIGTFIVLGEGPMEALVFPYVSDNTIIPSAAHDREQAKKWLKVRNERLSYGSTGL